MRICTIGHSTLGPDELVARLQAHGIGQVADVRMFPGSRRFPHVRREALDELLGAADIAYRHFPGLGGRRRGLGARSPNRGWRNESFRAYADHMLGMEFELGLHELVEWAQQRMTAIMCSEAVPWRCHRSLIADSLLVRGHEVLHVMSDTAARAARLTPFAEVRGETVTYPPGQPALPGMAASGAGGR